MRQQRGEWLIGNSKDTGASDNAVTYTRGAKAAVRSAEMMMEGWGGEVIVYFKGKPAGRLVDGHWMDLTNPTLERAIGLS